MNTTLVRRFAGCLAGSLVGAALLIAGSASAADLPTKKGPAPAPVVPPPTWTGFYASLDGGYAWDGSIVYIGPWNKGFGDTGIFGGANVGYNYQINSFVLGAQIGYDFANAKGNAYAFPYAVSADVRGFGSVDGRLGYAWGDALFYAIGGFSEGDVSHTISPVSSYWSSSYSAWQSGWDVGGGIAWRFTNNISGFAEFRKYDWGTKGFSDYYYPNHAIAQTLDVVRVGLTYNFGGPSFGAAY